MIVPWCILCLNANPGRLKKVHVKNSYNSVRRVIVGLAVSVLSWSDQMRMAGIPSWRSKCTTGLHRWNKMKSKWRSPMVQVLCTVSSPVLEQSCDRQLLTVSIMKCVDVKFFSAALSAKWKTVANTSWIIDWEVPILGRHLWYISSIFSCLRGGLKSLFNC